MTIRSTLISGEFFIADQIDVPALEFEKSDPDLDHGWHEFHSIVETDSLGDKLPERDLSDFLQDMQRASIQWKRYG